MLYPLSYEGGGWRIPGREPGGRRVFLSDPAWKPPIVRSCGPVELAEREALGDPDDCVRARVGSDGAIVESVPRQHAVHTS